MRLKFYDAEPDGMPSPSSSPEPMSVAAMMAKEGVMSHSDSRAIPSVSREAKVEANIEPEPAPVVTTTASEGNREPEPEPTKTIASENQSQNWQEVLKQQKQEVILKELGFDEKAIDFVKELKEVDPKMAKFFSNWKSNGDSISEYLKEMSTDYSKMPSEEVMRHQLREEYPKATERQLEVLFRKEIVEKYNLDSMDEDLVEEGKLLLDAKAEAYREKLVQKQQEYLLPNYEQKVDQSQIDAEKEFEKYKTNLMSNQVTQELIQNKRISIGEGDEKFNYSVANPNNIIENLLDSNSWANKLFDIQKDANGEEVFVPNVEKQLLVSAILEDHKGFLRDMAKYYKSLGGKSAIDSIDNPSPIGNPSSPSKQASEPKTPAEWMARAGRLV